MKTGKTIVFTSLGALGIASLFMIASSNASFGNFGNQNKAPMVQADTYKEFAEHIAGTRMEGEITEEEFNEMKERYSNREQNGEAIEEAIQKHDFSAWKTLHEGQDILDNIDTEAKFEKLIEMYAIMEDARNYVEGAIEKADAIAEDLGIERGIGQNMGGTMGERQGIGMNRGYHQGGGLGFHRQ